MGGRLPPAYQGKALIPFAMNIIRFFQLSTIYFRIPVTVGRANGKISGINYNECIQLVKDKIEGRGKMFQVLVSGCRLQVHDRTEALQVTGYSFDRTIKTRGKMEDRPFMTRNMGDRN